MRSVRHVLTRLFVLPLVAAIVVIGGAAVSANTSINGTASAQFTVPVTVSISQGSGGTCPGGNCNFGNAVLGSTTAPLQEDVTLNSNDSNGFSLTISTPTATVSESGCSAPNPSKQTGSDDVLWLGQAVTGFSTGNGGTAVQSGFNGGYTRLHVTPDNIFSSNPTATGTSMDDLINIEMAIPATAGVNTFVGGQSCSYVIPYTITVAAL